MVATWGRFPCAGRSDSGDRAAGGFDRRLGAGRRADALEHDLARQFAGLDHLDRANELAHQTGGGEVVASEIWGRRKLAYPIAKLAEAKHVFPAAKGDGKNPSATGVEAVIERMKEFKSNEAFLEDMGKARE